MISLILCILLNVTLFVCFKLLAKFKINTFQAIVANYAVCVLTGIIFLGNVEPLTTISIHTSWLVWAMLLGVIFIFTFTLMAKTTQEIGLGVASIATKMSLVIPVFFSLVIFDIGTETFNELHLIGIILGLFAIFLSSYKKNNKSMSKLLGLSFLLPLGVFLFSGAIDTLINYANRFHIKTTDEEAAFPIVLFFMAFVIGCFVLIIQRKRIELKSIWGGIMLGIPNFFSIYYMIQALTSFNNNGALFYPILNINIILFSSFVGIIFFKETLSRINKIGLAISVVALLLLSWQEWIKLL